MVNDNNQQNIALRTGKQSTVEGQQPNSGKSIPKMAGHKGLNNQVLHQAEGEKSDELISEGVLETTGDQNVFQFQAQGLIHQESTGRVSQ